LNKEQIIDTLRKVSLFQNLDGGIIESLAQKTKAVSFEKKTIIFREKEAGDKLFILIEGRVVLSKSIENKEKVVAVLQPVNPVGEMSILDDEPRSLTVKTIADSKFIVLEKNDFKEMIRKNPDISFQIFKILSTRLREATLLLKSHSY